MSEIQKMIDSFHYTLNGNALKKAVKDMEISMSNYDLERL